MTLFSGGFGRRYLGNSILLQVSKNKYIFIGYKIYSFLTNVQIVKFVSPVGNSTVPYPYAINSKGYYYFMLANKSIDVAIVPRGFKNDPYDYYYSNTKNIIGRKKIREIA